MVGKQAEEAGAAAADAQNSTGHSTQMNLVFFLDATEHIARLLRILRQPRGNAMRIAARRRYLRAELFS